MPTDDKKPSRHVPFCARRKQNTADGRHLNHPIPPPALTNLAPTRLLEFQRKDHADVSV